MKKYLYIIIIALIGVIAWQEYQKGQIVEQYEQKIVEMQDMVYDSCNGGII